MGAMGGMAAVEFRRGDAVGDGEAARRDAVRLNELLAGWHAWCAGHALVCGFPSVNASCRSSRASRQYDDTNGSLDAHIDAMLAEAVDAVVDSIAEPFRSALATQARNLYTGAQVWASPRLPACAVARADLLAEARNLFQVALARRELL